MFEGVCIALKNAGINTSFSVRKISYGEGVERVFPIFSPQIFSSPFWLKAINESDADIIHLHWFQNEMISISDLSKIKKPIVWTLHDMWGFCGAEHISYDNRWYEGYLKNNRPIGEDYIDLNRWTWKRKLKYWKKPINIITPSDWMEQNVKKSYLMKDWPVFTISNAIDIKKWKPIDKNSSRKILKLPGDLSLILFGSTSGTKDYHKGFDLLEKSLKKLQSINKKIGLVIFGEDEPAIKPNFKFPIFYLGFLQNSKSLIAAYSAADMVLIPSRVESFGQVASEANACSCPVIAFNTSGLRCISTPFIRTRSHFFSGEKSNIDLLRISAFGKLSLRILTATSLISTAHRSILGNIKDSAFRFIPIFAPNSMQLLIFEVLFRALEKKFKLEANNLSPIFLLIYSFPNFPAQKLSCSVL